MRDTIVILAICATAIIIGAGLYFYGPEAMGVVPETQQATVLPVPEEHLGPVEFIVVDEGAQAANVTERKNYLVNGTEEMQRLWDMVYGDSAPPVPAIDFMQYDIIAVFMGEEESGGYSISVSGVEDTTDERVVYITLTAPGESCMTTQAVTSPYQLVRVPVSALPLTKIYTEVTADCE